MAPCVRPHLRTVELDADARMLDQALRQKQLELKRQHEGTPFSAIVGRAREHTRRVALIAAVGVDREQPIVTADVYCWAEGLVTHCISTVIDQARRFVADSTYEAKSKAVLEKIRRAGRWLDWRDLSGLLRSIEVAERKRIVIDLVEGGDLLLKEESTKTKKHQWVKAVAQ
jgi:hypothetical protein